MTNVHLTVRRSPTGFHDYGVTNDPPVLEKWFKLKHLDFRQRSNNVNGKVVTIRVMDPQGRRDFEHDPCSIINFDVLSAHIDMDIYPSLFIYGFIAEMGWADDVDPDAPDGGNAYVPANIPWKPGLYQVAMWVGGTPPKE